MTKSGPKIGAPTLADQPVGYVEWVDPASLRGNDYNPNHVPPPEMELLKLSILENGWTQPIVTRSPDADGVAEIVDGFHRWKLGISDPQIRSLTGGLVPVVRLRQLDPITQRMATIRHNRARGTHAVVRMADIVVALKEMGVSEADIQKRLGMEHEEVKRLGTHGSMRAYGAKQSGDFNRAWVPGTLEEQAAGRAAHGNGRKPE